MNCQAPLPGDDDGVRPGLCPRCGRAHLILDCGWCPVAEIEEARGRSRVVALLVVLFVGAGVAAWWGLAR